MNRLSERWQKALITPLIILAWLSVMIVICWLLSFVVKTVLTVVFAGIVAFALAPLVGIFSRWMRRPLAVALAYVVGFTVILGLGTVVVAGAAQQITTLAHAMPGYADRIQQLQPEALDALRPFGVTSLTLDHAQAEATTKLQEFATRAAENTPGLLTATAGTVIDIILVLILSVYLLSNAGRITGLLYEVAPPSQRRQATLLVAITSRVVGGYIRGTLTLAVLIGMLVGAGMFALGVPYALLLGVLAFFMEFVPVVGVLISGFVSVLLALTHGPTLALIVLGYFVLVHVIEGDVVGPRILGSAIGIHPAVALIALVAGTELFGLWGALLGAPLAGLIQAFAVAAWEEAHGEVPREILREVAEEVGLAAEPPGEPAVAGSPADLGPG